MSSSAPTTAISIVSIWRPGTLSGVNRVAGLCGQPRHFDGDRIYIVSWYGVVTCYAKEDGRRIWQHRFDGDVAASPVIGADTIVLGLTDGALVGLDSDEGTPKWQARFANQITSTALVGKENCYVGTIDGDCLSVNIESGELIWKHRIGGPIVSSPAVAGEHLIVGSNDGNIYGISLTDEEVADLAAQRQ